MLGIIERNGSFLAQVRVTQQGVQVFSESKTFPTREKAESWRKRLLDEIKERGIASVAARDVTVGHLILKHLKYQQSLREIGRSSIHTHQTMAQEFDKIRLRDLKASHIFAFASRRRADGVAPATIAADLSPLVAAIHAAPFAHGIRVDPYEVELAMKKLKETGTVGRSRQVMRLVSPAEGEALEAELRRHDAHHQSTIPGLLVYRLALALPRRASELTRIAWADLDTTNKTILIRDVKHPRRKVGNHQLVPLLGPAWDLVQSAPVLGKEILPHNTNSVIATFERARDRLADNGMPGIKDLRFHDLRHTGITLLFQLGLKIEQVAVVSGHTNWAQLKRYTHIQPEDVHQAFDSLTKARACSP